MARQARADGRGIHLAITTDGHLARGEILLYRAGDHGQDAELSYAVGARYRRQKLAIRAVTLMTGYARGTLQANRVILRINPENHASIALARVAGFSLASDEPIIREHGGHQERLLTWTRSEPY